MAEDAEDDAVAASRIDEAGHGSGSASDFAERSVNDVGGSDPPSVAFGERVEVEQLLQVPFDAGHGAGPVLLAPCGPSAGGAFGLAAAGGSIDGRRLGLFFAPKKVHPLISNAYLHKKIYATPQNH